MFRPYDPPVGEVLLYCPLGKSPRDLGKAEECGVRAKLLLMGLPESAPRCSLDVGSKFLPLSILGTCG